MSVNSGVVSLCFLKVDWRDICEIYFDDLLNASSVFLKDDKNVIELNAFKSFRCILNIYMGVLFGFVSCSGMHTD